MYNVHIMLYHIHIILCVIYYSIHYVIYITLHIIYMYIINPGSGGGNDYTSASCGTDQVRYEYSCYTSIIYYYTAILLYCIAYFIPLYTLLCH